MPLSDLLDLLGRLGLDVLAMLLLVGVLYRRRLAAPEMVLVFTSLNIGLFAAVSSIGLGHFPTGVGFGLFGLLSLVRLRSTAFTLEDVAYTFVTLVLALVNGLPGRDFAMVVVLDVLLLGALWLVDGARVRAPETRVLRVTLDHAVGGTLEAIEAVRARLDVEPLAVVIEDVDLVRDTTRVACRVPVTAETWRPEPEPAGPAAEAPDVPGVLDAR